MLKELEETEETDKGGGKQKMDSYGKLENDVEYTVMIQSFWTNMSEQTV